MKKFCIIFLLTIGVSACSSTSHWRKALEKEWIGKTKDELVSKRKAPAQINSDTKGISIYIYMHRDFTPDILPNEYYEEFYVNSSGIIYRIKTYSR